MTEAENIDRVVTALLKVPEKKLLIIEIVNTIPHCKWGVGLCRVVEQTAGYKSSHCRSESLRIPYALGGGLVSPVKGKGENLIVGFRPNSQAKQSSRPESIMRGRKADEAQSPQPEGWALSLLADILKVGAAAADGNPSAASNKLRP